MTTALSKLTQTLATKLDMGDGADLISTLKATAFKGDVTDAQMTALLVIANQYGLNPWVKEIYAFPDKQNGIVPVVGVDGWSRIMNEHPQFDGIEFEQSTIMADMPGAKPAPEWMECRIYRKDRTRPIVVREYLDEVYRPPFTGKYGAVNGPWQSHTKRFLRHKTMIQCARLAFGFGGIYDQDEAERIAEAQAHHPHTVNMGMAEEVPPPQPKQIPEWPADKWGAILPKMLQGIAQGKSVDGALAWLQAKGTVTPAQEQELRTAAAQQQMAQAPAEPAVSTTPAVNADKLAQDMQAATDLDTLYEQAALMDAVTDEGARLRLNEVFDAKQAELEAT